MEGRQAPTGHAIGQIRTPDQRLRVFISSTLGELAPEREAAKAAVRTLRLNPVMFELGARPHAPQDLYRAYLDQSDIFVGVYWQSYGWIAPDMEISGIHDELLLSAGRPRLIYVKEPAPDRQPALREMLEAVGQTGTVSFKTLESPGELAELLIDDLAVLMSERFSAINRPSLPSGTMTFMFADIQGSTRIIEQIDSGYADVLAAYHRVVSAAVTSHGGIVVDKEGDGMFSAFPDAIMATEAAVEVQRALAVGSFPHGIDLRTRIGLHTGQATLNGSGYVGIDVHRAARIGASGHGGQIVLSSTAYELVADTLSNHQWHARDLGAYALKGLSRSEHLYQLDAPGLESEFPDLRARKAVEARLPQQLTSLVARGAEIGQIASMLESPEIRLVTLTGEGGIGKTRLGLAVAQQVTDAYPDGVYFVSLSAVTDPRQVVPAIADVADISLGTSPIDSLADALAHRQVLLILDNFEQVVEAAADLSALLGRSPGLNMLVTSRIALRVTGEREYQVEPLAVPSTAEDDLETVTSSAAVRLFEDRARAVRPDFEVTGENAEAIVAIVRRLDGLPLAIELAAARLRMLSPNALADHLGRSMDALGQGPQDLPPRQRTLRSTIDWSYALLDDGEKRSFRRLAVLADGWDLEAATEVIEDDAMDVVESLVDKSLVRVITDDSGETRFRMLATIREFGLHQLESSGEASEVKQRRNDHYLFLAVDASSGLEGHMQGPLMRSLDYEWENIRATADGLIVEGDFESLVTLCHSLWIYIWLRGHVSETSDWLRPLLDRERVLSDGPQGLMLWMLAGGSFESGDYDTAMGLLDESISLLNAAGDTDGAVWARYIRASTLPNYGADPNEILVELESILTLFRSMNSAFGQTWVRTNLAMHFASIGDLDTALVHMQECLRLAESIQNKSMTAQAHTTIGLILVAKGEIGAAREALERALEIHRIITFREGFTYTLDGLASLALAEADGDRAMTAIGAAEGLRSRLGFKPWPAVRWYLDMLVMMADAVTDPETKAARVAGREMDPMAAATLALGSPSAT